MYDVSGCVPIFVACFVYVPTIVACFVWGVRRGSPAAPAGRRPVIDDECDTPHPRLRAFHEQGQGRTTPVHDPSEAGQWWANQVLCRHACHSLVCFVRFWLARPLKLNHARVRRDSIIFREIYPAIQCDEFDGHWKRIYSYFSCHRHVLLSPLFRWSSVSFIL